MKIIYHCFGGSHSSVTAAAIHLGLLDKTRVPTGEELMKIPFYDKTTDADFGTIRFMGKDEWENEIYVLGKKSMGDRYSNILMGVAEVLEVEDQLIVVNCMRWVNWGMKLGGFTSRRLGFPFIGRPVVTRGTQRAFMQLIKVVEQTKSNIIKQASTG
ncbi:MAG: DUF3189 family protein [Bacillota bacterium]|nr:DUF3189 family protein [Bacillota bacterium]